MTSAGHCKIKCPYCDGHIEIPEENVGEWTACPHCAKEIPLDTPVDLPDGFQRKPDVVKAATPKRKPKLGYWLIALVIAVPLLVLLFAFSYERVGGVLGTIGFVGTGVLAAILYVVLLILSLYWLVCLILMPIFIYQILRTLWKIERNTRPRIQQ